MRSALRRGDGVTVGRERCFTGAFIVRPGQRPFDLAARPVEVGFSIEQGITNQCLLAQLLPQEITQTAGKMENSLSRGFVAVLDQLFAQVQRISTPRSR